MLPIAPLPDLIRWWQAEQTRGAVIGGVAVSLQSRPRITRDLDGLVRLDETKWAKFSRAGRKFGFVPRSADFLEFAKKSRMLLLRHDATGIDLDVTMGNLPFEEEVIARATSTEVAGVIIPLATPEDLVIMKAIAHREQDLLDIDALLSAHPSLDLERVRHWVQLFGDILDEPELSVLLEKRIAARRPTSKGKRKK